MKVSAAIAKNPLIAQNRALMASGSRSTAYFYVRGPKINEGVKTRARENPRYPVELESLVTGWFDSFYGYVGAAKRHGTISHIDWNMWIQHKFFAKNTAYVALPEEKDVYLQQDAITALLMTEYNWLFK